MSHWHPSLFLSVSLIAALAAVPAAAHADEDRLVLEMSFWSGLDVTRNGRDVGPGFLNLALGRAVRGSANAERHASNAAAWEITGMSLLATALGLLVAEVLVSDREGIAGGSTESIALGTGVFASLLSSVIARQLSVTEVFAAVNAYNRDLTAGASQRDHAP